MRQSPFLSGIIYFFLGALFTYFAIQNIQESGWGFFVYLLVILATFDFGSGIKLMIYHFANKKKETK